MASTLARPRVFAAVRARLVADATLTALLSTNPAAFGGGPAIYSESDVPPGATFDYLTIMADELPFNTMGRSSDLKWGSRLTLQIKVVSAQRNTDVGDAVLDRLMALLNGTTLTVSGYGSGECEFEQAIDPYSELVGGKAIKHFPSLWRVHVHQQA